MHLIYSNDVVRVFNSVIRYWLLDPQRANERLQYLTFLKNPKIRKNRIGHLTFALHKEL